MNAKTAREIIEESKIPHIAGPEQIERYWIAQGYLSALEGKDVKQMLREERKRVLESKEIKDLVKTLTGMNKQFGCLNGCEIEEGQFVWCNNCYGCDADDVLQAFNQMKGELG